MPISRKCFANQYQSEDPVFTGGGSVGHAFGFPASRVQVFNDRAAAVYVTLGSTTGTTGGHRTCSGESLLVEGVRTGGCAFASTTTSTATNVRVLALGG